VDRPLQITFHAVPHSDAVEAEIRARAAELEHFYDHIIGCRVVVDAPHERHHQGMLYSVRVDLHVPEGEIVVGRERRFDHAHEDVYVAIRDAFDAAVRQLEDYVRLRRGKVKRHEPEA
jgi:ribosome-associated translation inhibitor RaiA